MSSGYRAGVFRYRLLYSLLCRVAFGRCRHTILHNLFGQTNNRFDCCTLGHIRYIFVSAIHSAARWLGISYCTLQHAHMAKGVKRSLKAAAAESGFFEDIPGHYWALVFVCAFLVVDAMWLGYIRGLFKGKGSKKPPGARNSSNSRCVGEDR